MSPVIRWIVTLTIAISCSVFFAQEKVCGQDLNMNEMSAAASCKAYAEAQEIYHRTDYDGDGIFEYAQAIKGGNDGVIIPPEKLDASKLPKPSESEQQKIDSAIANLASDKPSVREQGMADLTSLGAVAVGAVLNALDTTRDLEVSLRCKKIVDSYTDTFPPRVFDSLHGLIADREHPALCLLDKAFGEAECPFGSDPAKATPKAGYLFRILTRQGKDAIGGRKNYIVNGKLVRGYALLAFPKEYGVTGRRVFTISNYGNIYERDFGSQENTSTFVNQCTEFNPDKQWKLTQ